MRTKKKIATIGNEISAITYGIKREVINNSKKLEDFLLQALQEENFTIVEKVSHTFQPHGHTIAILLSQSHVAVHTFPEYGALYFSLYSCRSPTDGRKTYKFLKKKLRPLYDDYKERIINLA